MDAHKIKVLIADVQLLTRAGLNALLNPKQFVEIIAEATNTTDLLAKSTQHQPKVVIMDYSQEPYFSLESIARTQQVVPDTNFLVITADLQREKVIDALGIGVKGFLTKECDEAEIVGAIRAVAKGEKFFCNKVLDILLERELTPAEDTPLEKARRIACEPVQLTTRELEIVSMMAKGLSAQQIAESLFLSVHTIYTHRKNIMRKLDVTTAAEVILYAINSRLVNIEA